MGSFAFTKKLKISWLDSLPFFCNNKAANPETWAVASEFLQWGYIMEIKTFNFTQAEFNANLHQYVEGCQVYIDHAKVAETLTISMGRRYAKLIAKRTDGGSGSRVFAFIDMNTGDILKPANWKTPAMHARGNIFDADFGLSRTQWTGPEYLK